VDIRDAETPPAQTYLPRQAMREQLLDARFQANFSYLLDAAGMTCGCNRCDWESTGPPAEVRLRSLEHFDLTHRPSVG
jgi:hypothetical protein